MLLLRTLSSSLKSRCSFFMLGGTCASLNSQKIKSCCLLAWRETDTRLLLPLEVLLLALWGYEILQSQLNLLLKFLSSYVVSTQN